MGARRWRRFAHRRQRKLAVAGALIPANLVAAGPAADNLMNAVYFAALFSMARTAERARTPIRRTIPSTPNTSPRRDEAKRDGILKSRLSSSFDVLGRGLSPLPRGRDVRVVRVRRRRASRARDADADHHARLRGVGVGVSSTRREFGALRINVNCAAIVMQCFFVVIGASGSIAQMLDTAPSLFFYSFVQVMFHLYFTVWVGQKLGLRKAGPSHREQQDRAGPPRRRRWRRPRGGDRSSCRPCSRACWGTRWPPSRGRPSASPSWRLP